MNIRLTDWILSVFHPSGHCRYCRIRIPTFQISYLRRSELTDRKSESVRENGDYQYVGSSRICFATDFTSSFSHKYNEFQI